MALTATIYNFATQLSDIDRGVYETLDLRMARQPSETVEYMLMRFLAYCLELDPEEARLERMGMLREASAAYRSALAHALRFQCDGA
jgi:uncharacterized protein YaeQ